MAEPKYHWAVHSTPELANHCNAWTGHTGGRWIQACRSRKARYLEDSAAEFCAKSQDDPDWFCIPCAKAARLALAKESAPKPTDVVWPKPRPISEAPKDGSSQVRRQSLADWSHR